MVSSSALVSPALYRLFIFLFIIVLTDNVSSAQENEFNFYYRISFRDKGSYGLTSFRAEELLSPRAIERRIRSGIKYPDEKDLPVFEGYINQISELGLKFHCKSKWMNTAVFKSAVNIETGMILGLPFVTDISLVRHPGIKNSGSDKLRIESTGTFVTSSVDPLIMLNGSELHKSGFKGEGILIGVLDGGFYNTDKISSLENLRKREGISGTYNIVDNTNFVYDYHNHGTAVLSVLAGDIPGFIEGSAPEANYILIRTEDTSSEFPVEEDFWAAGAELADSIGVDIISSSLGYFNFDDPVFDYKFQEMDGNTTFVTKAADIAASKGILVVNSAGNERNKTWIRIIAPSDGDSVLAVAAVDFNGNISAFSSSGPSSDGRVKPDVSAPGVNVLIQTEGDFISFGSGTSFSCPVISGLSACIKQAVPFANNYDIIESIRRSSDRYTSPDSLYGYGIPDGIKALQLLQEKFLPESEGLTTAGPNPFSDEFTIIFKDPPGWLKAEIYDLDGRLISRLRYESYVSRYLIINDPALIRNGIYIIRIHTSHGTSAHKLIRLKR